MSHAWGWVGWCGIIFGVHRCKACGVVATPKSLYARCTKEAKR